MILDFNGNKTSVDPTEARLLQAERELIRRLEQATFGETPTWKERPKALVGLSAMLNERTPYEGGRLVGTPSPIKLVKP